MTTTTLIQNNQKEAHGLGRQVLEEVLLNPLFKLHKCLTLERKQEAIEKHRQFYLQDKECIKENNDDLANWAGYKAQGIDVHTSKENESLNENNENNDNVTEEETAADATGLLTQPEAINNNNNDAKEIKDDNSMSLRNRDVARTNLRNVHANPPLREIREDSEETQKKIDPKNLKSSRRINFNAIN